MRPHHLRLTAFGPFAGTAAVDLDALAAGGLFLLHGPTGAGKTTLLDAMCFALFGSVPGPRGVRRLRSDHAAPDARCEVTFEVTVAGRRLRVTRSPAYLRAKRRGEGMTEEKGSLRVEELVSSRWITWSTRPDEAGEMISALVGMSAEQFTQVVLLPQGAFATFLHAGAADRSALLQQLFATDRFGAVEGWLTDRAAAARQQLTAASGLVTALLARVAQEAGTTAPEEIDLDWYDATLATVAAALLLARTEAVAADAAVEAAAATHRSQQDLAAQQVRHAAAVTALAALEEVLPDAAASRSALAAATDAAPLLPLVERAEQTRAAADTAVRAGDPTALRAQADRARQQLGRLEALAPLAERVDAAAAAQASALTELADLRQQLSEVAAERGSLPPLRAAAVTARDTAAAAHLALPAAEAAATGLRALLAEATARQQVEDRLARAVGAETVARERAVAAAEACVAVQAALVAGQAARLARLLVDGEPCAVCGGLEHPAPAVGDGAVPDDAEVDAAEVAAAAAQRAREAAGAAVAALRAAAQAHTDRLDATGWGDVSGLAAAAAAADDEVAQLRLGASGLADAEASVIALTEQSAELDMRAAGLDHEQASRAASAARQDRAAADDRAALRAALGDAPDLTAALVTATDVVAALDASTLAAVESAGLRAEAEAAARALAQGLAGTVFRDAAAVRAAALPASTLRGLADELAAYDAELAAARRSPDLTTPDQTAVDLAASGAVLAEREAEQLQRREVAAVRAHCHAQIERLGPELRAAARELAPLVAADEEVSALAELTRGGNTRGMRLSTYVLAARLEQVAVAASARLLQMTDGRYALRHTDVRLDRRSKGGLGLVVVDSWTGTERDTGTLSGGETFSASLALALGLADVVTAEAGGAPIEALFVDEGFGSLDEDALEEVMDVLDGLRSGGRVVGIVSHVAELRRRIPAQLWVHKGRDGSTLELAG